MDLKAHIIGVIKEVAIIPGISDDSIIGSKALLSGGVIDSLGLISIITSLERFLSTSIPHDQITMDNFNSVEAIENMAMRAARI